MCSCIRVLICSRCESDSSSESSPKTARRAVLESWSMARRKSLTSKRADLTSMTWQKIVA